MPEQYALFINGVSVQTGAWDTIHNPYNDEIVGRVTVAGAAEVESATSGAEKAFQVNRRLPVFKRAQILRGVVEGLKKRRERLAKLITGESGKPVMLSYVEVDRAITTFTLASEECKRFGGEILPVDIQPNTVNYHCRVERFPIGPIAGITPFNFPLNLTAHKLAPAIAVGSSLVLKPPVQCPLSNFVLAEIVHEAGAEPGTFNVVHMHPPLAEKLATDPRFKHLSVTSSDRLGWYLKNHAGKKPVTLELGGNAGAIVHEDADLDWAAERLAFGAFIQAGQVCISVQRVFIHKPVYERFKKKFVKAAQALKTGDPAHPKTVVGPCITLDEAKRIVEWIREAVDQGARVLCGGPQRRKAVVKPTVLENVRKSMKVQGKEVFGPVATLDSYTTFEQALKKVNDSPYGLQAGVFTHDNRRIETAFRELEVGGVIVNDYPTLRVDNFPYGGVKDSGLGREGVRCTMEAMTEPRVLVTNLNR